ncbi:Os11g0224800 [Oryza sativa Japonica Group]|uniref:Os11g0224800 protein n=1 Tax=Oryza sativa subsp. japonica TaxID=39947 RepID=A0A0P0Y0I7_ORYSJ|nr:Os11g0224800 [Oryza sativa Japonica Group]
MDDGEAARRHRHRAISGGLTALAVRLADRLGAASPGRNLAFSPLSVHAALSLAAAGAAGGTLDEILAVLGAASRDDLAAFVGRTAETALADRGPESLGPRVVFAPGVWCDAARPFKPAYRAAVAAEYNAEATVVDFKNKAEEARKQINAWARRATGKLITDVLPPRSVGPETAVVLGNAIYFKGKWDRPFNESDTERKPFYRHDGAAAAAAVADVPYMSSRSYQRVAVHDGFKVLKLRYRSPRLLRDKRKRGGGGDVGGEFTRYAMAIFLPDARDGLRGLVERMASRPGFLHEHMPAAWPVPVGEFRVPKFKVSCGGSVVGALEQLGLRLPFSPELADLSDMVEDDGSGWPLFVGDIQHKAVIEVNEEGTVAAAATMTRMLPSGVPPPPVDFVAEHPFAYFIVEEMSSAVVFAGHIVDPSME